MSLVHASFQSCCDTAASNQLGSANIIDNIIGSGNFGDHLYITWVPRGRPRRQARLLQRSPHTRIAGSLRVPSSPKGSHGSERASRRWCGRMWNFGHRSCRWLECVFCVQPASAMQSDNKCNIMVSSSTQRSKPRSDLDAKKEGDPHLRRLRRGDSMNRRLWAPNKQACHKGSPCRHQIPSEGRSIRTNRQK